MCVAYLGQLSGVAVHGLGDLQHDTQRRKMRIRKDPPPYPEMLGLWSLGTRFMFCGGVERANLPRRC